MNEDLLLTTARHRDYIADTAARMIREKYDRGVKEHGGGLWLHTEDDILDMAIEEAVDLVVFLLSLRDKRKSTPRTPNW